MNIKPSIKLIISCGLCLASGLVGSLFTGSVTSWYQTLNRPPFSPPDWIFAPVWTTLYILMGVSAFLIWQKGLDKPIVRISLSIFLTQLVLNILWTPLFFGLKMPLLALIELLALIAAVLLTIFYFKKLSNLAAGLLIPYLLWITFAAVLNASICVLN